MTERIVTALVNRFRADLPVHLARLRGDPTHQIPDPKLVQGFEYESYGIDQFPAVIVTEVTSEIRSHRRTDAGVELRSDNKFFVVSVVAGRTPEEVVLARQKYTAAIRDCLLTNQLLGEGMRINVDGFSEDHSSIDSRSDGQQIGSCRTTVVVTADEILGLIPTVTRPGIDGFDLAINTVTLPVEINSVTL